MIRQRSEFHWFPLQIPATANKKITEKTELISRILYQRILEQSIIDLFVKSVEQHMEWTL